MTVEYVKDVAERALGAASIALLALVSGDSLNVLTFDWVNAAGLVAGAAVLSVLKSLAVKNVGNPETGSVVS